MFYNQTNYRLESVQLSMSVLTPHRTCLALSRKQLAYVFSLSNIDPNQLPKLNIFAPKTQVLSSPTYNVRLVFPDF